jgi:hypothetical protein
MQAHAEALVGYGMRTAILPTLDRWHFLALIALRHYLYSVMVFKRLHSLHPALKAGHCLLLHLHLHPRD